MADEPQPPAPAPQQDHQTLVLTDPPPEKHHVLLWSLCIAAVALTAGGFVYWQFEASEAEVTVKPTPEGSVYWVTDLPTSAIQPAESEVLVDQDGNITEFFRGKDVLYYYAGSAHGYIALPNFDPSSFEVVATYRYKLGKNYYIKDKNNVYWFNPSRNSDGECDFVSEGLWMEELRDEGRSFVLWKWDVLFQGTASVYDCNLLSWSPFPGANPLFFTVVKDEAGNVSFWSKDNQFVFEIQESGQPYILLNTDPQSFRLAPNEVVGEYGWYVLDRERVFYKEWDLQTVEDADPASFVTVSGQEKYDAQDKSHKYLEGKIVATTTSQDSIATTTVVLDSTGHPSNYETDGTTIYYVWPDRSRTSVVGVDVTTFSIVPYENHFRGSPYGKDKNAIYYNNLVLSGANPNTFKSYSSEQQGGSDAYGKDEDQVWFWGYLIAEADAQTFIVFESLQPGGFHAQDKNHKYYQDNIIE